MQLETTLMIALLFTTATFLILQKELIRMVFGFAMLSNGANLLILAMSGSPDGKTIPIAHQVDRPFVDPLPQALILTAIVIGFGVTAYLVVLVYRLFLGRNTKWP